MHGTEYASVAALGRLAQTVRPMDVTGTLVLKPVAEAFHPPYLVLNTILDPPVLDGSRQADSSASPQNDSGYRLSVVATYAGIPTVLVEAGQRGNLDESDIAFIYDGVLNAMRVL